MFVENCIVGLCYYLKPTAILWTGHIETRRVLKTGPEVIVYLFSHTYKNMVSGVNYRTQELWLQDSVPMYPVRYWSAPRGVRTAAELWNVWILERPDFEASGL